MNKKYMFKPLSNKRLFTYDFVGFDVETYSRKNIFLLGGLYYRSHNGEYVYKCFYDKEELISFMLSNQFKGKFFVATNLAFDFDSVFLDSPQWNDFKQIRRGSSLLFASLKSHNSNKKGSIKFIDTSNYCPLSVESLGKVLGIHKLEKPYFLGRKPFSREEEIILEDYNKRDCEISCKFAYFFQEVTNSLGGKFRTTVSSTSLDIYRRGFMNDVWIKEERVTGKKGLKDFILEGYYGGRTEVYFKGKFDNLNYYDVNSLYPSVMLNEYPLPQSVKIIMNPSQQFLTYEGVSRVKVIAPENLNRPLLPLRYNNKLVFPVGEFEGVYNHCELRKAVELGYKLEFKEQIIYTHKKHLFKSFVEELYSLRMKYKSEGSPFELVVKLLLNGLYGKFGEKKRDKYELIDIKNSNINHFELKELCSNNNHEFFGNKLVIRKEVPFNGAHSFPIISSYTTSYARLLMYEFIKDEAVVYTDTDSLFTTKSFKVSGDLGKLKLEGKMDSCIFVKPKFYSVKHEGKWKPKVKGLSGLSQNDFINLLRGEKVIRTRFVKLKEGIRRGLTVNSLIEVPKECSLEDNKRLWFISKDSDNYEDKSFFSKPLEVSYD